MNKSICTFLFAMAASATLAIDIATPLSEVTMAYHTGILDDAERIAETHITFDSRSVDSKFVAARILCETGKLGESVKLLEENTKELPTDFRSWHLLGVCHVRLADEAEGIKCLKKALELNPYNGPSYLWLAKITSDKKEQRNLLEKVLVMEERNSPAARDALKMLEAQKDN